MPKKRQPEDRYQERMLPIVECRTLVVDVPEIGECVAIQGKSALLKDPICLIFRDRKSVSRVIRQLKDAREKVYPPMKGDYEPK